MRLMGRGRTLSLKTTHLMRRIKTALAPRGALTRSKRRRSNRILTESTKISSNLRRRSSNWTNRTLSTHSKSERKKQKLIYLKNKSKTINRRDRKKKTQINTKTK